MIRKIITYIICGLIGSSIGGIVYLSKKYMPHIWKNIEKSPVYAYLLLGFLGGCLLSYFWLKDKENKK